MTDIGYDFLVISFKQHTFFSIPCGDYTAYKDVVINIINFFLISDELALSIKHRNISYDNKTL